MKVEKVTPRKPEILEMASILKLNPDEVFGKLFRLWAWADDHTEDGNARGVSFLTVDNEMGVTGFSKAMVKVGWLDRSGTSLRFVNFCRHNGKTGKTRALTARRAKRFYNANLTLEALPREEKRVKKEIYKERNGTAPPFVPPTVAEVAAYFLERRNGFDAENFIAYYETSGWKQGKSLKPIKSWKACVVTWEKNQPKIRVATAEEDAQWNPSGV